MSSDNRTGGLFGRLFGGGKSAPKPDAAPAAVPPPADDAQTDGIASAAEAPPPSAAPAPVEALQPVAEPEPTKKSWFQRLTGGLAKTSSQLTGSITSIFTKRRLDADTLQDLEDALIQADLGVETAGRISDAISKGRYEKGISPDDVRRIVVAEVARVLEPVAHPLEVDTTCKPFVILVVGVNGAGKTTTIGKIAAQQKALGRKIVMAAGDTFRAAAIDQLKVWGERTGSEVIARQVGADSAGLAYDALAHARDTGADVLLVDTAGRLQNKHALMDELEKVIRVMRKQDPTAPHSVLLVLDATTGQNALNQVAVFGERAGVTGLVMTKLDGTARGGILVAIAAKHGIPIHAVGVGEGIEDLQAFDARQFAEALAAA